MRNHPNEKIVAARAQTVTWITVEPETPRYSLTMAAVSAVGPEECGTRASGGAVVGHG
jgi:hypothetical protein